MYSTTDHHVRPGYIQPMHGVKSRTGWYNTIYAIVGPLFPLMKRLFPKAMTTTEIVGRAMISIAKHGAPKRVLESADITAIGENRVNVR